MARIMFDPSALESLWFFHLYQRSRGLLGESVDVGASRMIGLLFKEHQIVLE